MKKFLFAAILALFYSPAYAYMEVVEVYRSSSTAEHVKCSTGTAQRVDNVTATHLSGFNQAAVRIKNLDSADAVYIGFDVNVTSTNASIPAGTQTYRGGEELLSGESAVYQVGKDVTLFCLAANAAGDAGARVSVIKFGYR